jgi:hypothetical protein
MLYDVINNYFIIPRVFQTPLSFQSNSEFVDWNRTVPRRGEVPGISEFRISNFFAVKPECREARKKNGRFFTLVGR